MARGPKLASKNYYDAEDIAKLVKEGKLPADSKPFQKAWIDFFDPITKAHVDTVSMDMAKLFAEHPETFWQCACHGANQKAGDSFASVEGNVALAISNAGAVYERLALGEWVKEGRTVGPRIATLYEAVRRMVERAGHARPTDEQLDAKFKHPDTGAKARADALATPQVKAVIAEIEKEKADARFAEAQKAAGATSPTDILQSFMS